PSTSRSWPSITPSVFFFQAEDGIRYRTVTGVQTCALPISHVLERQHRDRWAVGQGGDVGSRRPYTRRSPGRRLYFWRQHERRGCARHHDPEDPYRSRDVLDRMIAEVLERDVELVAHLVAHNAADA